MRHSLQQGTRQDITSYRSPIDTVHNDGKKEETPDFCKKHQSMYFQQCTRQQTTVVHVLLMYTVQHDDKKEEDDCQ